MLTRTILLPLPSVLLVLALLTLPAISRGATADIRLAKGQTVYVPVYSNVFSGPKIRPFQLAATLSIRNTDPATPFRLKAIDYYDTNGKLLRHFLEKPLLLGPMASTSVHIEEKDDRGGFGANFIVRWDADRSINAPIIETVMIGATSGQGISFVSPGQEIRENP
jgi:hypothetical protein